MVDWRKAWEARLQGSGLSRQASARLSSHRPGLPRRSSAVAIFCQPAQIRDRQWSHPRCGRGGLCNVRDGGVREGALCLRRDGAKCFYRPKYERDRDARRRRCFGCICYLFNNAGINAVRAPAALLLNDRATWERFGLDTMVEQRVA